MKHALQRSNCLSDLARQCDSGIELEADSLLLVVSQSIRPQSPIQASYRPQVLPQIILIFTYEHSIT